MMSIRLFKLPLVGLAFVGFCLPATAWTADSSPLPAPQIADVALRDGGVLVGQLVDGQNAPQSGVRVSLQDTQNREVGAAVTDRQGSFAISAVHAGLFQIVTPQGRQIYRIWTTNMAPPSAQQGVLLVAPGKTVRGEANSEPSGGVFGSPAVVGAALGAGVATAIAVPVAYGVGITKAPSSP